MTAHSQAAQPLSWLVMEQYHLGELPPAEMERVRTHLSLCGDCAECMDSIVNDPIQLKPLPEVARTSGLFDLFGWITRPAYALGAAAVLILSVAIFMFARPGAETLSRPGYPEHAILFKGGDLALTAVRERNGVVSTNPEGFLDGDRFSLSLTCPMSGEVDVHVVLFQGKAEYFPLGDSMKISCGNQVPLSGAFALDGPVDTVACAIVENFPGRAALEKQGAAALPEGTVCLSLKSLK